MSVRDNISGGNNLEEVSYWAKCACNGNPGTSASDTLVVPCSGYSKVKVESTTVKKNDGTTESHTVQNGTYNVNGQSTMTLGTLTITSTGGLRAIGYLDCKVTLMP